MTTTTSRNGRLGNQIFRNIAVSIVSEKQNLLVNYSSLKLIKSLGIPLFSGTRTFKKNKEINLRDDNYFEILSKPRESIESNLQPNYSYFQTNLISNFIYNYLRSQEIRDKIMECNPFKTCYDNNSDCFIHIRLTDVANKNPGIDYYLKALAQVPNIESETVYIASDDVEHSIIKSIVSKYPKTVIVKDNEIRTIQFGSTCKHIILSHGSFSAVIGYLGFFSHIYYPKYDSGNMWYGDMFSIPGWNQID